MGVGKGVQNGEDDTHGFGRRKRLPVLVAQHIGEITPTHQFHVDENHAVFAVNPVDMNDMGVIAQAVKNTGFFQYPVSFRSSGTDFLERDLTPQQGIPRQINDPGRAVTQHIEPFVLANGSRRHSLCYFFPAAAGFTADGAGRGVADGGDGDACGKWARSTFT